MDVTVAINIYQTQLKETLECVNNVYVYVNTWLFVINHFSHGKFIRIIEKEDETCLKILLINKRKQGLQTVADERRESDKRVESPI